LFKQSNPVVAECDDVLAVEWHGWALQAHATPSFKIFPHICELGSGIRHDWHICSPKKPPHADGGAVFPGVQKSIETRDHVAKILLAKIQ
jgi:hypothetical protein